MTINTDLRFGLKIRFTDKIGLAKHWVYYVNHCYFYQQVFDWTPGWAQLVARDKADMSRQAPHEKSDNIVPVFLNNSIHVAQQGLCVNSQSCHSRYTP